MKNLRLENARQLTFSQREGRVPLPKQVQLGQVPTKFRNVIWRHIDQAISALIYDAPFVTDLYVEEHVDDIPAIIWSYRFDIKLERHDRIPASRPNADISYSRELILEGDYHEVITFIEYILRHEKCSTELCKSLIFAFDETLTPYFVTEIGGELTVVPRSSLESGETTAAAIETIDQHGMSGATTHLRKATKCMNEADYSGSVRESIHAVESVACTIDQRANKSLGPALDSLEKVGLLKHPALKEALKKLYGYTSDKRGIRHSEIGEGGSNVDLDEAIFMLGACASFVAYLVSMQRKREELN